jgi:hypothetical protein
MGITSEMGVLDGEGAEWSGGMDGDRVCVDSIILYNNYIQCLNVWDLILPVALPDQS